MKKKVSIILLLVLVANVFLSTFMANASSGEAYSIGGEFHGGADTISAANNWALCGYSS